MNAPRIPAAHLQAIMDALEAIDARTAEVKATDIMPSHLVVIADWTGGCMLGWPHILLVGLEAFATHTSIHIGHSVYMELRRNRDRAALTPRHAFSL